MTDDELRLRLDQVGRGDRAAFEVIYHEMKTPLFTIILRMTQDRGLAEDILQEFFLKLFQSPPAQPPRKPRAYLFQMAHNLTIDSMKKLPRHANLDDFAHLPGAGGGQSLERLDLEQAFHALTLPERQIVSLHLNGGLKFREVAAILNCPLGTVLWKYQRAIGKLRTSLNGGTT